jgi:hypothetical protein
MDGRSGEDSERWKMPKLLRMSRHEYARQALRLDRYYSPSEIGGVVVELRLDFPSPGLSDDPRDMRLMLDMHRDSLIRYRSRPFLSP